MPTYTIFLAQDVAYYGSVAVEADTWEEAVASLTFRDWDECYDEGDGAWEQRVVHVEAEDGDIVDESMDLEFNSLTIYRSGVIQRLREIQIAPDQDAALAQFIDELLNRFQHPIFKKKETDQ